MAKKNKVQVEEPVETPAVETPVAETPVTDTPVAKQEAPAEPEFRPLGEDPEGKISACGKTYKTITEVVIGGVDTFDELKGIVVGIIGDETAAPDPLTDEEIDKIADSASEYGESDPEEEKE